jgi:hypothetical protein
MRGPNPGSAAGKKDFGKKRYLVLTHVAEV